MRKKGIFAKFKVKKHTKVTKTPFQKGNRNYDCKLKHKKEEEGGDLQRIFLCIDIQFEGKNHVVQLYC